MKTAQSETMNVSEQLLAVYCNNLQKYYYHLPCSQCPRRPPGQCPRLSHWTEVG